MNNRSRYDDITNRHTLQTQANTNTPLTNSTEANTLPQAHSRQPDRQNHPQANETPSITRHSRMLQQAQSAWRAIFQHPQTILPIPQIHNNVMMTTENLRENGPWGDTIEPKPAHITRFYAQNVNGFPLDRRGGKFDQLCKILKEVQVDVFCGQEHNLDTTQVTIRNILYDTARQHWERSKITFATTPIQFTSTYKPGGSFLITTQHLTSRVTQQLRDKWGRWTIQEYQGHNGCKLVIISAYQVVSKRNKNGLITAAAQQQSLLLTEGDKIQDPCAAFSRDILVMLTHYRNDKREILLLGDFNEALGSRPDGMTQVVATLGLVNLMTNRHNTPPPSTYARGKTCLDYAVATPNVAAALQRSGYEAFKIRLSSDHRGYFFDFDTNLLFGSGTATLAPRSERMLKSANAKQVTAYLLRKHEIFLAHNVYERIKLLHHDEDRHEYAERLDRDVLAASLAAERSTRYYGTPKWSVQLQHARKKTAFLSKWISMHRTGMNKQSLQQQFESDGTLQVEVPTSLSEAKSQLRQARKEAKVISEQSFTRRDTEREQKIRELETSPDPKDRKTAKRLRCHKKAETRQQMHRKLKAVKTSYERKGVTKIEIPIHPEDDPKSCTEWQVLEIPEEILRQLQLRNQNHFGQAHGTPFTIPPLSGHLGFSANTTAAHDILRGAYDTGELSESLSTLIRHLQQTEEMAQHAAQPTITESELAGKLKAWRESTTTSPSGMHLGHYKAMYARHQFSTDDPNEVVTPLHHANREKLDNIQHQIRAVHLTMLNYALKRGHSYERWRTIANTILFKDPDNVRLHRTRVIHIYEADYNLALGIKWRSALFRAEAKQQLNPGQYGSRPKCTALEPVLVEEMQYEIARATRQPLALTNYDAASCYDRIVPSLAMLISKKYGVPPTVTTANALTLELAKYRIRTDLGLASEGYTHSPETPIYGTGQGSGNSPAIWCFLSGILFDCYEEAATPAV